MTKEELEQQKEDLLLCIFNIESEIATLKDPAKLKEKIEQTERTCEALRSALDVIGGMACE